MTELTGQCYCGKNTYAVNAEPEFQFVCYCDSCQKLHGGGRLCGMVFDASTLTEAQHSKTFTYEGGSGKSIHMHFCPECSTQLYGYPTEYENKVVIKSNTLKSSDFKPQQCLFAESAHDWDALANTE